MSAIQNHARLLSQDARIELFDIDLSHVGGPVHRVAPMSYFDLSDTDAMAADPALVYWRGNPYLPAAIEAEGFDLTSEGTTPRPVLRTSNVLQTITTLIKTYGPLEGGRVTRWVTRGTFLDTGATPDPNAHYPAEVYWIDQKTQHTRTVVEYELASILDQQGSYLPGRQVLRDHCQLLYRIPAGGGFDYTDVTCPYTGSAMFTEKDVPTTNPAQDRCSQSLVGCRLRFGSSPDLPIPFGGFPSVGRIR